MTKTHLILIILIIGILYRLILTAGGNFLFNMDNARDMVDVREMVMLGKMRLTGPTSAIEGFYNGPAWYYLLAVPFILSGGDPYSAIIMEIALWAIGGFFLLHLVGRWGRWLILPAGALWIASNYIVLTNLYAFNPNPVTLLSPLFIYLLFKYLEKGKAIYAFLSFLLGGLFFNFEMNFGIFIPLIIGAAVVFSGRVNYLKQKGFWIGATLFALAVAPQILFDLKHQFIMSKSILRFLSETESTGFNLFKRTQTISSGFLDVFSATLMNQKAFAMIVIVLFAGGFLRFLREKNIDKVFLVSLIFIMVPFTGYLILPVNVNAWHWGGEMAVSVILIAFLLKKLGTLSIFISLTIIFFAVSNIVNFFKDDFSRANNDPSLYKNEIAAIDYVYKYAKGENFKAYIYLPSVYDYPYQYLFWWYGKKKYGYIPAEYVYARNKPQYIPSQDKFQGNKDNYSGLVYLIKEPDRIKMRQAWEGDFNDLEFISKASMGSIEVEIRREKLK